MRKLIFILIVFIAGTAGSSAQGTWNPKPDFVTLRCLMSAFTIGNYGYIGTGISSPNPVQVTCKDLWQYNPVTSIWTQMANLPAISRRRPVGFTVNGKGYFGLGLDSNNVYLKDLWEYDPTLNTWSAKANFPGTGRFGAIAFGIGNFGYVGTGSDGLNSYNDLWQYNPATNAWTAKANFPGGTRLGALAFVVGNKGYVGTGAGTTVSNDLWEYNPATNTWAQKAPLPAIPRQFGVGITIFNRGYIGTGLDSTGNYLDDWFEYNPATNSWAMMTNFPNGGRYHMIGFGINCRGYIGTGHYGSTPAVWFNDWWEFVPPTYYFANINSVNGFTVCPGGSATLIASGGASYIWSTGSTATSIVVSPTVNTTYSVVASTNNVLGCTSTASVTVLVKPMNLSIGSIAVNCGSTSGSASVNISSGGIAPYTYLWSPTGQTTAIANGLNAAGTYTVNVTSSNGCVSTGTVTVVSINAPFTTVTGSTAICSGSSTTLTAQGANSYSWSNGISSSSIVVNPSASTTYTVTGWVGSCEDTAQVRVTIYPSPVANTSGNISLCPGETATITASGGAAPYTYLWNTGATTTSFSVSPTSTTTYSVMISIVGCKDSASLTVTALPSPTVSVSGNTILCKGDTTTLTASGGTNYSWSNSSASPAIVVSPPASTTYSVIAANSVGCKDTSGITVNVFPPPIASVSGNNNICQGFSASLTASGGINGAMYLWNTGETSSVIHPDTPGNYAVVVTLGTCTDSTSINLFVHPLPTANVSPNVTIVQGQSTELSASGGTNYYWNNSQVGQNIVVSPQAPAEYCVTVYDANNCWDTACVKVFVLSCETAGELYLPNAFSPNGDGENDYLQIYFGLFDCIQSFKLFLFNRWGEKIYQTTDPYFKWNGDYNKGIFKNSGEAGSEVFVYYVEVGLGNGNKISRTGNVSLIR